jgi:hypothetical protein
MHAGGDHIFIMSSPLENDAGRHVPAAQRTQQPPLICSKSESNERKDLTRDSVV